MLCRLHILHSMLALFRGVNLNTLTREEIIEIVFRLKSGAYATEQETDSALAALKNGVLDPKVSDYIFFDDLTPEEIADKVLSYKPILL